MKLSKEEKQKIRDFKVEKDDLERPRISIGPWSKGEEFVTTENLKFSCMNCGSDVFREYFFRYVFCSGCGREIMIQEDTANKLIIEREIRDMVEKEAI